MIVIPTSTDDRSSLTITCSMYLLTIITLI